MECSTNGTNLTLWTSVTVNGSSTSTELTSLMKWSCYEVQVRALTIKNGVWCDAKKYRSSEDGKVLWFLFQIYKGVGCVKLLLIAGFIAWLDFYVENLENYAIRNFFGQPS